MPRQGRTSPCTQEDARTRLRQAESFIEVAELTLGTDSTGGYPQVAASLAVLAGIAASDAACCARLGQRSRSQDHRQAIALLASIPDASQSMAQDLRRLLAIKDGAHYSSVITAPEAEAAVRRARRLYESARTLTT